MLRPQAGRAWEFPELSLTRGREFPAGWAFGRFCKRLGAWANSKTLLASRIASHGHVLRPRASPHRRMLGAKRDRRRQPRWLVAQNALDTFRGQSASRKAQSHRG